MCYDKTRLYTDADLQCVSHVRNRKLTERLICNIVACISHYLSDIFCQVNGTRSCIVALKF